MRRFLFFLALTGCDSTNTSASALLSGNLDRASFPLGPPTLIEARDDDGTRVQAAIPEDGSFHLALPLERTWALRLSSETGGGYVIALARPGHFDRALIAAGRAEARLGVVWLPPRDTAEVTRVAEVDAARCLDGRLDDGAACAVIESLVSCADGQRPLDDPTALLLGVGGLDELPGTENGARYALASWVPPPILWECPEPTPP